MQTKFIVSQAHPHDKIASRLLFFYHVMTRDHMFSGWTHGFSSAENVRPHK